MHVKEELFNDVRIIRNIKRARHWLTTSTRGVESEVVGTMVSVAKTVRGLTITLDTGKKVVWQMPAKLAERVNDCINV